MVFKPRVRYDFRCGVTLFIAIRNDGLAKN